MERRSIRKYKDTPVEHEKLATIVKCGINAPSGINKQPWEIRVVESQELINQVNEVYKKANPDIMEKDPSFKNMFRNAPNLICVATAQGGNLDCGLLGENMMLAAQSMGLGTCCLGGPVRFIKDNADAKFFLEKLGFSEGYDLIYILAIGYPDESPDAKPRDESKVQYIK
jgi:nitroreductase